jgi:hypothetical protein
VLWQVGGAVFQTASPALTMRLIRDSRQGTMTPEEMRARAQECEEIAQQVSDFGAKEIYEELAQKWRAMAAQAERSGSDEQGA